MPPKPHAAPSRKARGPTRCRPSSVPRARLAAGIAAFELLHEAGLAESRTEARKLIKGGGGRLNDKPIAGDTATVGEGDLDASGTLKLSAGRKRHVLVRAV